MEMHDKIKRHEFLTANINDADFKSKFFELEDDDFDKLFENIILYKAKNNQSESQERPIKRKPFNRAKLADLYRIWDKNQNQILGYKLNKFPRLTKSLDGLRPGLHIIGADANVGKTGVMISFAIDVVQSNQANQNMHVIFVSLDDHDEVIYSRLIACAGQTTKINLLQKKGYFKENDEKTHQNIMHAGRTTLQLLEDKISVYDRNSIKNVSELNAYIQDHINAGHEVVLFVDALLNLDLDEASEVIRVEHEKRAQIISLIAGEYNIPLITSAELRKRDSKSTQAKPGMADIAESRKYSFEGKSIIVLTNDNEETEDIELGEMTSKETMEVTMRLVKNKYGHIKGATTLQYNLTKSSIAEKNTYVDQDVTKFQTKNNSQDVEDMIKEYKKL